MKLAMQVAAVLDTMWGRRGTAPGWFRINPHNHSGKRLIKMTGAQTVWVTNACPQQTGHALQHGKPDAQWLRNNLERVAPQVLLICGNVAQAAYDASGYVPPNNVLVLRLRHPAARNWTVQQMADVRQQVTTHLGATQ